MASLSSIKGLCLFDLLLFLKLLAALLLLLLMLLFEFQPVFVFVLVGPGPESSSCLNLQSLPKRQWPAFQNLHTGLISGAAPWTMLVL